MIDEEKKALKPKVNSSAEKELDKVEAQFKEFDKQVQDMTLDRMNKTPKAELEPHLKMSQEDILKSKEIYLKPKKIISSREKFNEKWRDDYNFMKEFVYFTAENHEIIGESIDIWCKPFPGLPAEEWIVPVNTPVWGPRYLAEQIKRKYYHRLKMDESKMSPHAPGVDVYGQMAVDSTIPRLDARPVSRNRSIFVGESGSFAPRKPVVIGA